MRKLLVAVLLAGSAGPALAAPEETSDRRDRARSERAEPAPARAQRAQERAERAQARAERSERPQVRAQRGNREEAAAMPAERQQLRSRRMERSAGSRAALIEREQQREAVVPVGGQAAPRARVQRQAREVRPGDSVRDWRAAERQRANSPATIQERNLRHAPLVDRSGEDLVQPRRPLPRVLDRNRARVGTTPAPGTQPPEPEIATVRHAEPTRHWRTDWRRDHRYDWRNHRHRHRSLFRLGFYIDPFGWNYHRYGIGWRLWPSHYSNRFWLNDPWMYRLPPAYGPYRWVRYWDDALLVNLYTGQVVDVIHNVFW